MKRGLVKGEKIVFAAMLLLTACLCVATPFFVPLNNLFDTLLLLCAICALFLFARTQRMPLVVYWLVFIIFLLHSLGVLGLFSTMPLGLGYDKYLHFTAGLCFTVFFVFWLPIGDKRWRFLVAVLCLMGFAAIGEIVEFSGTHFLRTNRGGFIAQGDGQVQTGSPLQVYDTHFDLIFNLGGSLVGLLVASILSPRTNRTAHRKTTRERSR